MSPFAFDASSILILAVFLVLGLAVLVAVTAIGIRLALRPLVEALNAWQRFRNTSEETVSLRRRLAAAELELAQLRSAEDKSWVERSRAVP